MTMRKMEIFRFISFIPDVRISKKVFERFDSRLRGVTIESVEVNYAEDGNIEKVDILYTDKIKKVE